MPYSCPCGCRSEAPVFGTSPSQSAGGPRNQNSRFWAPTHTILCGTKLSDFKQRGLQRPRAAEAGSQTPASWRQRCCRRSVKHHSFACPQKGPLSETMATHADMLNKGSIYSLLQDTRSKHDASYEAPDEGIHVAEKQRVRLEFRASIYIKLRLSPSSVPIPTLHLCPKGFSQQHLPPCSVRSACIWRYAKPRARIKAGDSVCLNTPMSCAQCTTLASLCYVQSA